MEERNLSGEIIGAAIEVHRWLGPGLLESAYELALARELTLRELSVERQKAIPLEYKGQLLGDGFRIDLLVDRDSPFLELCPLAAYGSAFQVGASVIVAMQNYLAPFGAWVTVIQGAIFVVCVVAFRAGIVGEIGRLLKTKL